MAGRDLSAELYGSNTATPGKPPSSAGRDLSADLYEASSLGGSLKQGAGNVLAGALRGAGSIGATILAPYDMAKDALAGKGLSLESNSQRRSDMDAGLQSLGAEPESWMYKGGKLAGELAGTAGVGGVLAKPVQALAGNSVLGSKLSLALASSGMSTGGSIGTGVLSRSGDMALRAGAGAVVGGASAGMVDPESAGTGALVGAATPGALQLAGKLGSTVYNAVKGNSANAGKLLAQGLGVSPSELTALIKAANAAPESIVPGSKLTLSQALETQGANSPSAQMLERIAAQGPGGDVLLKRYADQGTARMNALQAQGAQVYQGAAKEESTQAGNQIGAYLRTQASDERTAVRHLWKGEDGSGGVYGRARDEGIALQLPLERMEAAMGPLGRGSVIGGNDARNVMRVAQDIGNDVLPGLKPIPQSAGQTQSLEQAVRGHGGIQPGNYLGKEIAELGRKQSKTTGLVSKYGRDVESMANTMHERGFLPDNDPASLIQALRSGGGRRIFADDHMEAGFQRMAEAAAGDMPEAGQIVKAVPFDEFQRLRRDSGALAAKQSARPEGGAEAGVLTQFQKLLAGRADDAAAGNLLSGENMTPGFMQDYNAARDATRQINERYSGGNNIAQILRKPVGQNYTLGGDEVTNKLWHGGSGLQDDVRNLRQVLSADSHAPAMGALQRFIMTDAASKTKASGDLSAALPRYVETRMPGLLEALNPDQMKAITGVASDIRNSDAASSVSGLLGSDTYAKASRAMDAGLLDAPTVKRLSGLLNFHGIGLEPIRSKLSDIVVKNKGQVIANLMSDPKAAAEALQNIGFRQSLDGPSLKALRLVAAKAAPILAAD